MTRSDHMFPQVNFSSGEARRRFCKVLVALAGILLAAPAHPQIRFPGPEEVILNGEALSAVSIPDELGTPDFLVSGAGDGILALHRFSSAFGRFILIWESKVGGRIVDLIPWEGRPFLNQGVVAATANPDRVVFIQILSQLPFITIEGYVDLEEDPGMLTFLGEPGGGVPELAVSLPGIDQVAFLRQDGEVWHLASVQDTGDRPHSILGIDLDGDLVRELVTANRGPLSGTLGIFRRDPAGDYEGTQQDFAAGIPSHLASYDIDNDGLLELAATVEGSPELVLLHAAAGQLVEFESVGLTLPADFVHMTVLFDGTPGLFTTNQDRRLVDFFQLQLGTWIWRNSYYPGCGPIAIASGEFNGDDGRDLVSVGGDANMVTVMFANSQPGFWGFPAQALSGSPGASGLGDFDQDGRLDLVVSNWDQPMLSFFPGLAEGGFAVTPIDFPLSFFPGAVAVLDSDDDPGAELAVLDGLGGEVCIADFVSGQGFSIVSRTSTGASPFFITARDIDADGYGDLLIITREVDEVRTLFGAGDNSFPTQVFMGLDNGADWAEALDLNADGLLDLALTDGGSFIWTTLNQGNRSFGLPTWQDSGPGASIMAIGDLDQDLDEDIVVVNRSDESLAMFENTGTGVLTRRVDALNLMSAPSGILIRDMDRDGHAELVMNLREEGLLGISIPQDSWEYFQPLTFSGGPNVTMFSVEDLNLDDAPDILTLNHSPLLGLTLLNVEQQPVAVEIGALRVWCDPLSLEIRIQPDRPGPWQVDFGAEGQWIPLAVSGQAMLGDMDYDSGTWTLTVDRLDLGRSSREGLIRLTVGQDVQRETLDLSLANQCPEAKEEDVPLVAWAREPWPNPFNPLVNARFVLRRDSVVQAAVYDLAGRRVAVLVDGWIAAGDHALQWDGSKAGRSVGAGVYMLRISTPEKTLLHKIMLIK